MAKTIESGPDNVVTIKVVGIGGAGNNVVNRMVKSGTQGVEFVSINTDKPALSISAADQKVHRHAVLKETRDVSEYAFIILPRGDIVPFRIRLP